MSTTQGPYTVVETSAPSWARHRYKVTGPSGDVTSYVSSGKQGREWLAQKLNAAYAAGQSSKQAELDKAVGLLREMERFIEGDSHIDPDCARRARAYLSTLNPQPDAAQ